MSNRDDWPALVKEILRAYDVTRTLEMRGYPDGAPTAKTFRARLEWELHNAFVAGQESEQLQEPHAEVAAMQQVAEGFLETARRRVGHNSSEDEVSQGWNNGVERAFEEVTRAIKAAFDSMTDHQPKLIKQADVDAAYALGVSDTKDNLAEATRQPERLVVPEGMVALDVTICTTPEMAEAVRTGKLTGFSMSGREAIRSKLWDAQFGMDPLDIDGAKEPENLDEYFAGTVDDPNTPLGMVRLELRQDQQKLWEAIRTVESLVHCGCCHGSLETHDGHCPIAYADAVEMRVMNYIASKGEHTDGRINRLHSDVADHETSIKNQSSKLCKLVRELTEHKEAHLERDQHSPDGKRLSRIETRMNRELKRLSSLVDGLCTDEDSLSEVRDQVTKLKADLDKHKHEPMRSFLTYGSEDAERWHHKQHDPPEADKKPDDPAECFIPGLGTVRECLDCGCLTPGGPTRCKRCADSYDVNEEVARDIEGMHSCMDAASQLAKEIIKEDADGQD